MRIFHYLSYFIILLAFGLGIYILFLLFYPLKPVVFFNSPFPVKTPIVKQGGQLIYTVSHCKYVNVHSTISRSLVDSIQFTLPEISPSVSKGCATLDIMTVTIPMVIPPGSYYLNATVTYHINPLRSYTVNVRTEKFQVVE